MRSLTLLALILATPATAQTEWASLLGNGGSDWILAMKTDAAGRIYICGETNSTSFPVTSNAFQSKSAGGTEAFVACIDPSRERNRQLVWSSYLGGNATDSALDLHVRPDGRRVVVVGHTTSTDFPVTAGCYQAKPGGGRDGFIAAFDPGQSGRGQLSWASYLGGAGEDVATSVDASWRDFPTVALVTRSPKLPTTAGALQSLLRGPIDAFVVRLSPAGDRAQFATYFGGGGREGPWWPAARPSDWKYLHVAVDPQGRPVVAGITDSASLPTSGAYQTALKGGFDLFVARFDRLGRQLEFSTYHGGSGRDIVRELRLDGTGVVLSGGTLSLDYPVTKNALQTTSGGRWDGFCTRIDLSRKAIDYSTYIGGGSDDACNDAYVEPSGTIVLGLVTATQLATTTGAPRARRSNGLVDVLLMRLRPQTGTTQRQYATYYGGNATQDVTGMCSDGRGGVYLAGTTTSTVFPTTSDAHDRTFDAPEDGWLAVHELLPQTVTRFGVGTAMCGARTYAQVNSQPRSGNTLFAVECHAAPASSSGVILLGAPLPGGLPFLGATVYVDPSRPPLVMLATQSSANGYASVGLPIPNGVSPTGKLAFQFLFVNPTSCSGPLSGSNAIRW